MIKKILLGLFVIATLFMITGCGKEPGKNTISLATKDGVKESVLQDGNIVYAKEYVLDVKKNTMTDKKTGKTIEYEITDVSYELTAKKAGETTLTLTYVDYKTNEEKKDVFHIKVDKDLNVTVEKE